MKNFGGVFYVLSGIALLFVGMVISGVSFAEEGGDAKQAESLESLQEKASEGKDTTFDFFGLRSGVTFIACRDFFRFNQGFLDKKDGYYFYTPRRRVEYLKNRGGGDWESFSESEFKEAGGVVGYLHRTKRINLQAMRLDFTSELVLWKLQADFGVELSKVYTLAKYDALKAIFPEAEISLGAKVISVVLLDSKVALGAMLKAQSEYGKYLKAASQYEDLR